VAGGVGYTSIESLASRGHDGVWRWRRWLPNSPPRPDFTLSVDPTTQSVSIISSGSVTLSATALDGFSSQIGVQVTGVPSGVSVSPASFTLLPGSQQKVTISTIPVAASANQTVSFTGVSGSLTHTAQLSLSVTAVSGQPPVRTRYVRTDATTQYFGWINQHWIVYDPVTARYFVTDPSSNQVIVIDGASQTKLGTIGVPGAFGIDETPDHSTVYVGTQIGDVYTIDPVRMTVTNRYMASKIGPSGYPVNSALVLSDGRLALIGPYNGIAGVGAIAIWNPASNAIVLYGGAQGQQFPCGSNFGGTITGFNLSADRTQILLGSGETLCEIDASAGTGIYTAGSLGLGLAAFDHITVTPDGTRIIFANYTMQAQPSVAVVIDAHTLALLAQFNVLGDTSSASGFFVSGDSTTLFTPGDPETGLIYAYDLETQQLVGWVPNIFVPPLGGGGASGPIDTPYLLATDGTGLFAGPLEEGVGFVDLSVLETGPVGTQFNTTTASPVSPATGPTAGGTPTQWSDVGPIPLESIYFGVQQATGISATPGNSFVAINATSPSGPAGPADVYLFTTDGGMQLLPEAFSYGPTILEVTPDMATADGGGTGYIYGYGFGSVTSNAIPSGLTVTVNGIAAQVTAFAGNAYNPSSPPSPIESIAYTIPPGSSGTAVSVTVTTDSGEATAAKALTYLPASQPFQLAGAALAQGIYDSHTDLYYFTDTTQIQVFSRTQGMWLAPIPITPPPGATERLWGIALSPNGTMMAVADMGAGAIYLLNPSNPTAVKTFPTSSIYGQALPCGIAVSDQGMAYYATAGQAGFLHNFFKLDTNTGQITDYGINGQQTLGEALLRTLISSDNSEVFFNDQGYVFSIDTATDKILAPALNEQCCSGNYELALSSSQTQFTANSYIFDSGLNAESYYALNDREIQNTLYVYGAKFSPDGRLLFQPSASGIDVFSNGTGNLQDRISLPHSLSPNYDALVGDGTDNVLVEITGAGDGIAVIDLTSVKEPQPLPNERTSGLELHRPRRSYDGRMSGRRPKVPHHLTQRSPATKHLTRVLLIPK